MKCEACEIDFPDNDSPEAKYYGEYLFNGQDTSSGICLHCWTKSNGWQHDNRFSSCPECNEHYEDWVQQ